MKTMCALHALTFDDPTIECASKQMCPHPHRLASSSTRSTSSACRCLRRGRKTRPRSTQKRPRYT